MASLAKIEVDINKLDKIKREYSINEAVVRVSRNIGEKVTREDLLSFVLDGRLKLSFKPTRLYGALCESPNMIVIGPDISGESVTKKSFRRQNQAKPLRKTCSFELSDSPLISEWISSLISGSETSAESDHGIFIRDENGNLFELWERAVYGVDFAQQDELTEITLSLLNSKLVKHFPDEIKLRFKSKDLLTLENEINQLVEHKPHNNKREINSLLKIIHVLALEHPKYNYRAKRSDLNKHLETQLDLLVNDEKDKLTSETIGKKIKKAAEYMKSRKK
ncbi:MAG: hypothetical protein HRU28_11025 [Rhizobiales bacterium]|nr:hypothetical protein [Hyphomicrobiales bacterium]